MAAAHISKECIVQSLVADIAKIRATHPLVHNITNYVAMNSSANILLAIGASPIMAHSVDEMEDLISLNAKVGPGALAINIGTLDAAWIKAMQMAGELANKHKVHVVLDPVGAGASNLRTKTSLDLLDSVKIDILRGNASEIMAVAAACPKMQGVKAAGNTKGVDSSAATQAAVEAANNLATLYNTVVGVSGEVDYITDGKRSAWVRNGVSMMPSVTALGCGLTSVMGAFLAVQPDAFMACVEAFVFYGLSGEVALKSSPVKAPGSFFVHFVDSLYLVDAKAIQHGAKVEVK